LDVRVHIRRRIIDRGHDVTDPGKVKDVARVLEDPRARLELADILPIAGEIRVSLEVLEVAAVAAREIVDHSDSKAPLNEQVHHVAADESGATGDDGNSFAGHAALSRLSRRTL